MAGKKSQLEWQLGRINQQCLMENEMIYIKLITKESTRFLLIIHFSSITTSILYRLILILYVYIMYRMHVRNGKPSRPHTKP